MQKMTLWGWFFLLLRVAAAQSSAEPLEQIVRFHEPAQRVSQVLQQLSRQADARLVAARDLQDEIVLIDAERLTVRQLMDALAIALDAEWQQQPDGSHRLYRPVDKAQRRRAQENERLARFWREEVLKNAPDKLEAILSEAETRTTMRRLRTIFAEALSRADTSLHAAAGEQELYTLCDAINPVRRLLYRLLRQMDWKEFTQVPVEEVRVYSNLHGAYLRPLPRSTALLLQQFRQEAALVERLKRDPADGVTELKSLYEQRMGYGMQWLLPDLDSFVNSDTLSVFLTVYRWNPNSIELDLHLVARCAEGRMRLRYAGVSALYQPSLPEPPETGDWRSHPVEWSALSRLQLRVLQGDEQAIESEQLLMLDPARVEPLSLAPSDILRAYARCRRKPLVALLPDSLGNPLSVMRSRPIREAARLGELESYLAQWEWIEGTALIAKPLNASYLWGKRCRREATAPLVAQAQRRGYCNEWEDLPLATQIAPDYDAFYGLDWWLEANGIEVYYQQSVVELLRAMNAPLWQRLLAGETLSLSDLPPAMLQRLNYHLFCTWHATALLQEVDNLVAPAVVFPDGLPRDTRLQLEVSTELGFFIGRRRGVWHRFMERDYAEYLLKQDPDAETSDYYRNYLRRVQRSLHSPVQYGRRIEYRLRLIPPGLSKARIRITLPFRYELIGTPTRWDEPPDEVKRALEAEKPAKSEE